MTPTFVRPDRNDEPPPGDRVLLLAKLPEGLHVAAELLGTNWAIAQTPEPCELVLPQRPPDSNTSRLSRPLCAPDVPGADRVFRWWTQHEDDAEWGRDWHHGAGGESSTAYAKHGLIVTRYAPPDDGDYRGAFTRQTGTVATAWLNALAEWLEVLCGVDLQPNQPHGPVVGLTYLHNVALGTTVSADRRVRLHRADCAPVDGTGRCHAIRVGHRRLAHERWRASRRAPSVPARRARCPTPRK